MTRLSFKCDALLLMTWQHKDSVHHSYINGLQFARIVIAAAYIRIIILQLYSISYSHNPRYMFLSLCRTVRSSATMLRTSQQYFRAIGKSQTPDVAAFDTLRERIKLLTRSQNNPFGRFAVNALLYLAFPWYIFSSFYRWHFRLTTQDGGVV